MAELKLQEIRGKHEKEKVLWWSWPPCRGLTWRAGQPNDSRGARDDGRGGKPLLKPGSVGPCPIDGLRRVEEISTSSSHNGRRTQRWQQSKQKWRRWCWWSNREVKWGWEQIAVERQLKCEELLSMISQSRESTHDSGQASLRFEEGGGSFCSQFLCSLPLVTVSLSKQMTHVMEPWVF